MTTRKGRGVSSLTALTQNRKKENSAEAQTAPQRDMRVFKNYKDGKLNTLHQRICEIVFSAAKEGEIGIINVDRWKQEENITSLTFRNALKYLSLLGYIEILPPTRQRNLKGTTIRVIKAYEIPPPSERMVAVYEGLRKLRRVKDGKETQVALLELGLLTGLNRKTLVKNITWIAIRRYIKVTGLDEAEGTLKFCFTGHRPQQPGDEGKATTQE
jgi:hypothetical protein